MCSKRTTTLRQRRWWTLCSINGYLFSWWYCMYILNLSPSFSLLLPTERSLHFTMMVLTCMVSYAVWMMWNRFTPADSIGTSIHVCWWWVHVGTNNDDVESAYLLYTAIAKGFILVHFSQSLFPIGCAKNFPSDFDLRPLDSVALCSAVECE